MSGGSFAVVLFAVILGSIFVLSWSTTWVLRKYALRMRLLDVPGARSSHSIPTPRGGGLAIIVAYIVGVAALQSGGFIGIFHLKVLFPPLLLIAGIGFLDDHRDLPAGLRLAVHFIGAGIFVLLVKYLQPSIWFTDHVVFSLLVMTGLVWTVNLTNFMDGIDGLAGMEIISVAGGAAFIFWLNGGEDAYLYQLLLLAAGVAGFLAWNWPPARIFMGDACSGFLGMAIGLYAIMSSSHAAINILSWLILYGIFVVDATVTLLVRIMRRQKVYQAHRSHAYQILSRQFSSHKKVTLGALGINIFWLFPLAVVSSRYPEKALLYCGIAYLPLIILAVRTGAGTTDN